MDVNYGGSAGYGRKYTERLKATWGLVDTADCVAASSILSQAPYNLIDSRRTAIRGLSAGGFTALASLCRHPEAFAAGCSGYGIADLKALARDTHKYESHFMFGLMGGTPDEIPHVYKGRSPLYNAEHIKAPLLVLHGTADMVVPQNQTELIVETVRKNGSRIDFKLYEGEGHGWRRSDTITDALERELAFYRDVFGLSGQK